MKTITSSPSILITGATGQIGTELTKQLAAQGIPFRALVRSIEKAGSLADLPGAELFTGDLSNEASMAEALKGIERTFLLTNSTEHAETLQINFVNAAQQAGVKHIVKLSQYAASADSPVRYLRYHAAVEQKIRQSGIAFTFLRPNLFMQGLLLFRDPIVYQGKFFAPAGDAKVSIVDIRDIAAVAVAALTSGGHEGKIYNLTGPEALSHTEMAGYLSASLSREIRYINVSPIEMRKAILSAGLPEWQAEGLLEDYAHYSRGEAAMISPVIEEITGRTPRSFNTFSVDYRSAFS